MSQSTRQRYVAIVIVGALHILILEVLIHAPRSQRVPPEDTVWSTLFFVPAAMLTRPVKSESPHAAAAAPRRLPAPAAEVAQAITMAPEATPARTSIDWMSALQRTAADMASQGGSGDAAFSTPPPSSSLWVTHHHAYGEQYQLQTGETVVWVSDHCFVMSEPQLAGTPNAFAHAALTHTQCERNPDAKADLFKELPAYKKHNEAP
jgi:hypothetical protein